MKIFRPYTSVTVSTKERAGRAPYNFVPLPREAWKRVSEPPKANAFQEGCHTGEMEVGLLLKTDFYTRGMWKAAEYRKQVRETIQPLPYMVDGQVRLPGSSLRGMVRSLIEILSFSPMGEINNTQMFFRSVASVPDPGNVRSFEPQAKAYKDLLLQNQELKAQAGYLYGSRKGWYIQPATVCPATERSWHRYRTRETWIRRKVRFDIEDGGYEVRMNPQGREEGWLVCSGGMNGKQKQWIVRAEDPDQDKKVELPWDLVAAYKENGVTKQIRDANFDYNDQSKGVPCFYVTDPKGNVAAFGHTAFMRMPYERTPREALPPNQKKLPAEWDFVERLFGRVQAKGVPGARGRVSFEDGVVEDAKLTDKRRTALGQPKPTTYQHYLVQADERVAKSIHWDGDVDGGGDVYLRGHKMYWHRPLVTENAGKGEARKDNVATEFIPVANGVTFRARIRFENLSDAELGALLTALALPQGCAHKLGMAKPLGFGSIQVVRLGIRLREVAKRYGSFFDAGICRLATGERRLSAEEFVAKQDAFAAAVLGEGVRVGQLWSHPRLAELRAMLTLGEAQFTDAWSNKTRYLEFGRPTDWETDRNYNEYNEIGHPDQPRKLSKRRPLPPATQVLGDKNGLPQDARPKFK